MKINLIIATAILALSFAKLNAQITILHPNENDTLIVGESANIEWINETGNAVSVSYSVDSGKTWQLISKNISENTVSWTVPYLSNKHIQFKVEEPEKIAVEMYWENLIAHEQEIKSCSFSEDGKYYITAGEDGCFKIWDIASRELNWKYTHSADRMNCAKFWDNADTVVYATGNSIFLWQRQGDISEFLFTFSDRAVYIDVNKKDGLIAACSWDGYVVIYSIRDRKEVSRFLGKDIDDIYERCRFSHSGEYLVFSGYNNIVNLYNLKTKEFKYHQVNSNVNIIWGLDFSFDDSEIITAGLDSKIRRFDVATMQQIAVYDHIYDSHVRSVRYVNEYNDFISGDVLSGGYFTYGNLERNEIDSIPVGYQITDVDYHYQKYYGVAGRKSRAEGKFTIFEIVKTPAASAVSSSNAYYRFFVDMPEVKARYNEAVNFPMKFEHNYKIDSIPFNKINLIARVAFPGKLLNFTTPRNAYEIRGFDFIYGFNIDNILDAGIRPAIAAKVILGDTNYAPVAFEACYSSNPMVLYETNDGSIEITADCISDLGRFIIAGKATSLEIDNSDKTNIIFYANIAEDDEYKFIFSNAAGQILYEISLNQSGRYPILLPKSVYPGGAYFIRLFSAYNSISNSLILLK